MVFSSSIGAWLAAASITCVASLGAHAQSVPPVGERVLSAVDVVVTQEVFDADGSTPVPVQSRTAFTLQKVRTAGGSTSVRLAYRATQAPNPALASSNPLDGARVEYDPSSGSTTVFDQGGVRLNPRLSLERPPAASLGSPQDWLEALVFKKSGAPARREEVERSFGRAVGRVGRLTRYVQTHDGASEEMLVDPDWSVPVELTVTRQNAQAGHVTFEYASTPSGNLYRRGLRTEQMIDAATGRRSVLAIEFSNVRAEGW